MILTYGDVSPDLTKCAKCGRRDPVGTWPMANGASETVCLPCSKMRIEIRTSVSSGPFDPMTCGGVFRIQVWAKHVDADGWLFLDEVDQVPGSRVIKTRNAFCDRWSNGAHEVFAGAIPVIEKEKIV